MKNPGRDMPRVIHTALPVVICLFVLKLSDEGAFVGANLGYFAVLPMEIVTNSRTIGLVNLFRRC